MTSRWVLLIITFITVMANHSVAEPIDKKVSRLLPKDVYGWKVEGRPEIYTRETLYNYMDGAAEIYLTYDFQGLLIQRYTKARNPEIIVEIFDMGSSEDAFGVFSHGQGRALEEMGIGQDSEYRGGLLSFWKDRFFICVRAGRETQTAKRAVLSKGKRISKAIKAEGKKPGLLNYLPEEDLIEKSIRYFHSHVILNYHYFVSDENILNLDEHTKGVLAKYKENEIYLLLVQYPHQEQARAAFESFMAAYMPEAKERGVIQTENSKWTGARLKHNFIAIVFDAPSEMGAISRIEAIISKLR